MDAELEAVAAAKRAFPAWSPRTIAERRLLLSTQARVINMAL